jgi:hypothetical protein
VKVEFPDEATGIGERMWVRVTRCDDDKQLIFGVLDNEPLNDYQDRIDLGSELAVRYRTVRQRFARGIRERTMTSMMRRW